jgi:hypothetical protein
MDLVSLLVKKELLFEGHMRLGSMRTTTFNAWSNMMDCLLNKEGICVPLLPSTHRYHDFVRLSQNAGELLVLYKHS